MAGEWPSGGVLTLMVESQGRAAAAGERRPRCPRINPFAGPGPSGVQSVRSTLVRHWHAQPYAAVVLQGGYHEAGEAGRYRVEAGDVLVHAPFSVHQNTAGAGALVLNLPLPLDYAAHSWRGRLSDPDRLARLAERDLHEATACLMASVEFGGPPLADAPDQLAAELGGAGGRVADWAAAQGVDRATAYRWFRNAYGVSPARFRIEARARRTWRRLAWGAEGLAQVALAEGFSDQAHMTREVKAITGLTPGAWRSAAVQQAFKAI